VHVTFDVAWEHIKLNQYNDRWVWAPPPLRDRPLAPDCMNAALSMKNCTMQPRHLCASRSTHATTVSPSRKSMGWRAARELYLK